ncbi:MAG: hypothetical protein VSS75_001165 [Candidatus Parabeggiatoa sp.]|nr:hypothetical protein [Candidatus Parabeggiatoa sp.]
MKSDSFGGLFSGLGFDIVNASVEKVVVLDRTLIIMMRLINAD